MVVTIDIGNTNISFGIFKENNINNPEIQASGNLQTNKNITTDELAIHFLNLMKLWNLNPVDLDGKVIISSVVPQIDYEFVHMFQKYYKTTPYFVSVKDVPIKVNYDFPDEIGADRLVNAYAGVKIYPLSNLIIVDFGTATTFDIVTGEGSYEGGLIMTGILTSLRALEEKASKLPHIDLSAPSRLIGKNTVECIRSGIINGNGAMVDEIVNRISNEMGWKNYTVIATGGMSKLIKASSRKIDVLDSQLTLKGLFYIWLLKR